MQPRRRLDDAFQACAASLAACVAWLLGGPADPLTDARRQAVARERLLDAAVRQLLSERGSPPQRIDDVTTLLASSMRLRVTGDGLASLGQQGECTHPDAARNVHGDAESVRAWYAALGASIAAGAAPPTPAVPEDELPTQVLEGVSTAAVTGNNAHTVAAVVVSWCSKNLNLLRRLEAPTARAATRIAQDPPA